MSVLSHICNGLFSIGEDGFETRKMTSFYKLFRKYQDPKESFNNSSIIHVRRTYNTWVDCLAHSVKKPPFFVVYMDTELPVWFAES